MSVESTEFQEAEETMKIEGASEDILLQPDLDCKVGVGLGETAVEKVGRRAINEQIWMSGI